MTPGEVIAELEQLQIEQRLLGGDQRGRVMTSGPLRLAVTGGRDYANQIFIDRVLNLISEMHGIKMLIHGACPSGMGADWIADAWAAGNDVPITRYPVLKVFDGPWPAAGPRRNARMLHQSQPDRLVAFAGGRGTASAILHAARLRIPVWELGEYPDGKISGEELENLLTDQFRLVKG